MISSLMFLTFLIAKLAVGTATVLVWTTILCTWPQEIAQALRVFAVACICAVCPGTSYRGASASTHDVICAIE